MDCHGVKGLALESFSYPLSQAELEDIKIIIVGNNVMVKLNSKTIYQAECVNLGDGSAGANARS